MLLDAVDSSSLFSAAQPSNAQLQTLQQRSLSRGMDFLSGQKYEEAIKEFKRAVGYSPFSSNAITAYQFIAQSYSKLNDSDGAIGAYAQALKIDPSRADIHVALGNVHYFNKDYQNAVKSYEAAVRYDPGEANRYSLGQGYLANGQFSDAEAQFARVAAMSPNKPSGKYGLGLVYLKQGQHDAAISAFREALSIKSDFYEAYSEMGYALADSGRLDEATRIKDELAALDKNLSSLLGKYINTKTPPSFVYVESTNFNLTAKPNTPVISLGAYLVEPGATRTFSVNFTFSKSMEASSVQSIANWVITRARFVPGQTAYNFGMPIADTEVSLAPHPVSVSYNSETQTATVFFTVSQNASADGTIDPGHIDFKFLGHDSDGHRMAGDADQYTGFHGIA